MRAFTVNVKEVLDQGFHCFMYRKLWIKAFTVYKKKQKTKLWIRAFTFCIKEALDQLPHCL